MTRIPMPLVYEDDPDEATTSPAARDLDYVPSDLTTLHGNPKRKTMMDEEMSDELGICQAWITIQPRDDGELPNYAFIEDVGNYA